MLDVLAWSRLCLGLGRTRDLDPERRVCVASSLSLKSDIGPLLPRDRCGDRDRLRGRCNKDLRAINKFDELPDCCAKQDEFEDDRSESCDEDIAM